VASSALGSPIKNFTGVFKLDQSDPHLLPDLSAAVVIAVPTMPPAAPPLKTPAPKTPAPGAPAK
jgi:hypothetical protein